MVLGIGDTLSVKITGDSSDLNRAIDAAQRNLDGLNTDAIQTAAALQLLSSEADDASGEIRSVGTSSSFASGGLTSFSLSTESAGFAVRGLSSSILVSLLPALAALSAALAPIVTSLGGFVAIAGSIGGIGLAGAIAAIATRTKTLKHQVQDIAQQLEEAFAPAIDRALSVIQALLGEFENIIPQLVPAQSAIEDMGASFFRLGKAVINLLPSLVELAVSLADEFLPPFVAFVQNVGPKLPGIIRDLVADFERLLPKVLEAGRLIARIIPPLTEFGFTVLNVLGPALADAARAGTRVLNFLNSLDTRLRKVVAAGALLAPVLYGLVSVLGGPVTLALGAAVAAVIGLKRAWETNFLNIRGVTQDAVGRLQSVLGTHLPAIVKNLQGVLNNLRVAWRMVGDELITIGKAVLDGLSGVFTTLIDAVVSMVRAITAVLNGDFGEALDVFAGFWRRTFNGILDFVTTWGDKLLASVLRIVAAVIEGAGTNLSNFLSGLPGVSVSGEQLTPDTLVGGLRQRATRIEQQGVGVVPQWNQPPLEVAVNVKGDTEVVRDVTVEEISRRERQQSQRIFGETGGAPGGE